MDCMPAMQQRFDELVEDLKQTALLNSCTSVLGWDEQTYLPPGGAEHRANQLSLLAGLVHEQATSPRRGELIADLENGYKTSGPDSPEAAVLREARRDYDRATKLPRSLVEELSRVT